MDVRWMASSIALLARPEIVIFRAEKILQKTSISAVDCAVRHTPSQKHVHMCMFLRIAHILIQINVSNLATTAPGTGAAAPIGGYHWLL